MPKLTVLGGFHADRDDVGDQGGGDTRSGGIPAADGDRGRHQRPGDRDDEPLPPRDAAEPRLELRAERPGPRRAARSSLTGSIRKPPRRRRRAGTPPKVDRRTRPVISRSADPADVQRSADRLTQRSPGPPTTEQPQRHTFDSTATREGGTRMKQLWERWAPLAGLLAVACSLVGVHARPRPATGQGLRREDRRLLRRPLAPSTGVIGFFVFLAGILFLLVFLATLRERLLARRRSAGTAERARVRRRHCQPAAVGGLDAARERGQPSRATSRRRSGWTRTRSGCSPTPPTTPGSPPSSSARSWSGRPPRWRFEPPPASLVRTQRGSGRRRPAVRVLLLPLLRLVALARRHFGAARRAAQLATATVAQPAL